MWVYTAAGAESPSPDFLIQPGRVGKLSMGMLITDIWKYYPKELIARGFVYPEGIPKPVIEIRILRGQKEPSICVRLDESADKRHTIAGSIQVLDPRFKTAQGVGPGSSLADVRKVIPDLESGSFEGVTAVHSDRFGLSFILAVDVTSDYLYESPSGALKSAGKLPGNIRVGSVLVYRRSVGHPLSRQ